MSPSLFKILLLCSPWISNFALMLVLKALHYWVFWPPLKYGSQNLSPSLPHLSPSSAPALGFRVPAEPGPPLEHNLPSHRLSSDGPGRAPPGTTAPAGTDGVKGADQHPPGLPGNPWECQGAALSWGHWPWSCALRGFTGTIMTQAFMPSAWI